MNSVAHLHMHMIGPTREADGKFAFNPKFFMFVPVILIDINSIYGDFFQVNEIVDKLLGRESGEDVTKSSQTS